MYHTMVSKSAALYLTEGTFHFKRIIAVTYNHHKMFLCLTVKLVYLIIQTAKNCSSQAMKQQQQKNPSGV